MTLARGRFEKTPKRIAEIPEPLSAGSNKIAA
jgi:hypothetical protein